MRKALAPLFVAALWLAPHAALAHGTYESSTPKGHSTVDQAPPRVTVTLTEEPAEGSSLVVRDGCKDDVVAGLRTSGRDLVATIGDSQPGSWTVRIRSISAVDGHVAQDSFSFQVSGKKDCSPASASGGETPGPDETGEATSSRPPIDNDGEPSSFPVVPLVIGSVVVVGGAFLLRRASAGS